MFKVDKYFKEKKDLIDRNLVEISSMSDGFDSDFGRKVLLASSSRNRAIFSLAVYDEFGKNKGCFDKLACSVEYAQSASLIRDALPFEDNHRKIRGIVAPHFIDKEHGIFQETSAFTYLLNSFYGVISNYSPQNRVGYLVGQASSLAGEMNSAQFYDVLNLVKDKEEMIDVYRRKSGNLFVFSGILGAESKEGSNNLLKLGSLGVAYQIFDDLKDKDEDKALGRKTLLDFVEEGEAKNLAYNYLEESKKVFDNNKFLNNVMDKIVRRRKFYKLLF